MNGDLRILLLEDEATDAELIEIELRRTQQAFALHHAKTKEEYVNALPVFQPDIVLADYGIPGFDGAAAATAAKLTCPDTPVVIVSGSIGEEAAVEALKGGAADYVLKDRLSRLGPVVRRALEEARERVARRKAEDRLRLLATVVFDSNDAITLQDFNGRILAWNRSAERMYGWTEAEALGMYIWEMIPKGKRENGVERAQRTARGEAQSLETRRYTKDGRVLRISVTMSPVLNDSGEATAIATTERDITEQKLAEERLARHALQIERSNADLRQFAHVASHDLQEPLRMTASCAQLLALRYREKLDGDADEIIGRVVGGVSRMQELINGLSAYSRVGRSAIELAPTASGIVLEGVVADLQSLIDKAGAEVTHDPLPTVLADEAQLAHVFQNLIANAVKFSGEGPARVHVGARRDNGGWSFSVRDNGTGIERENAERIFLIFQRLHTDGECDGAGIGLAICKGIVERHGGRIWVDSEPGKGSTFYFTMPDVQ